MRSLNAAGIQLIKIFEGCKLTAYDDGGGKMTIGYGHTGKEVVKGLKWTQEQADEQFRLDSIGMCATVEAMCKGIPLNDNQFAALVSFAYNLGPGRLRNSSLFRYLQAGNFASAKAEFAKWDKLNGIPLAGLTRRRQAEADLFGAV